MSAHEDFAKWILGEYDTCPESSTYLTNFYGKVGESLFWFRCFDFAGEAKKEEREWIASKHDEFWSPPYGNDEIDNEMFNYIFVYGDPVGDMYVNIFQKPLDAGKRLTDFQKEIEENSKLIEDPIIRDEIQQLLHSKYVNVYVITRNYGGPEEGGWWYNAGHFLRGWACPEHLTEEFRSYLEKTFEYLKEGDIYSVLGGQGVDVIVENQPGQSWPKTRPRYE